MKLKLKLTPSLRWKLLGIGGSAAAFIIAASLYGFYSFWIILADYQEIIYKLTETRANETVANINAEIQQKLIISLALLVLAVAVTLVIFNWFANHFITKPVKDLSEELERFASGDFTQEIEVNSRDELGLLADKMNHTQKN